MKASILSVASALLATAATASPLLPRASNSNSNNGSAGGDFKTSPFNSNTAESDEIDALRAALANAETYTERQNALLGDGGDATNYTFTFINNTVTGQTGGTIALGTRASFPALIGTEVAQAFGWVNPCGLNVPHSHPRANEWLTVISGFLVGGLVLEANNGNLGEIEGQPAPERGPLPSVNATMGPFTGMLFPQGQTHFQFNPSCEPALFTAAFDSSDPGRLQVARNFFSFPDEVVANSFGDVETIDVSQLPEIRSRIPDSYAVVMEECAKKCGL